MRSRFTPSVAILLGIITGVAGGILRDVLLGEVPLVFRREINLYATAALGGAALYVGLHATGIAEQVAIIQAATEVPVCVGFGVSNPSQAAEIASKADGVVVGSAIVKLIEQNGSAHDCAAKVEAFVKPLVDAVHDL